MVCCNNISSSTKTNVHVVCSCACVFLQRVQQQSSSSEYELNFLNIFSTERAMSQLVSTFITNNKVATIQNHTVYLRVKTYFAQICITAQTTRFDFLFFFPSTCHFCDTQFLQNCIVIVNV
mmetsp:Transcript_19476/g.31750  ORF Transcript_19476/g.31750 Transcript_19476/m.31750 type:complete len:121 (+) Transcript_19476:152-514(+)